MEGVVKLVTKEDKLFQLKAVVAAIIHLPLELLLFQTVIVHTILVIKSVTMPNVEVLILFVIKG